MHVNQFALCLKLTEYCKLAILQLKNQIKNVNHVQTHHYSLTQNNIWPSVWVSCGPVSWHVKITITVPYYSGPIWKRKHHHPSCETLCTSLILSVFPWKVVVWNDYSKLSMYNEYLLISLQTTSHSLGKFYNPFKC